MSLASCSQKNFLGGDMKKNLILEEFKKKITENHIGGFDLANLKEEDVSIGNSYMVYCLKFKYQCTGIGQKFGGGYRFPLTKDYKTNAMWFYEKEEELSKKFVSAYVGDDKILEELGGVFELYDPEEGIKHDAFFKLRQDFRMYDCQALFDTIRIDDYEEFYRSTVTFNVVCIKNKVVGYVATNSAGESFILNVKSKFNKLNISKKGKRNWLFIVACICWPPLFVIYLIYKGVKKALN